MKVCPTCNGTQIIGVEHPWNHRHHYDGVSEWRCGTCGTRVGRWTGKILGELETERPFGGTLGENER